MKGYSEDLYILAFDHRGTITKGLLGGRRTRTHRRRSWKSK